MTQMLLFDAPASPLFSAAASAVAAPTLDDNTLETPEEPQSTEMSSKREDGGLHHMGDLARLVLLRYELMAKRRARRAARA